MNTADLIDLAMHLAGHHTQADLARASGVPTSTLARILSNESQPTLSNIAAIAKACKCSIDSLVPMELRPQSVARHDVQLIYCLDEELSLLTQYRLSTELGKQFIQISAKNAEKKNKSGFPTDQA